MERVRTISGNTPVLIVAPHGFDGDDEKTAFIAEIVVKNLNACGVINLGWERGVSVDFMKDKADCNNVNHCHEDVVKEEFLDPIIRYKDRLIQKNSKVCMFHIHGMSNRHRLIANDPKMDMVVGYGEGYPQSLSCDLWKKNMFIHLMEGLGVRVYEGSSGGKFSGWGKNNMNQLFRKWYFEPKVQSMQIEIVHELRSEESIASETAYCITKVIEKIICSNGYDYYATNNIY